MPVAGGISFTGFYLTLTVTQIKILLLYLKTIGDFSHYTLHYVILGGVM